MNKIPDYACVTPTSKLHGSLIKPLLYILMIHSTVTKSSSNHYMLMRVIYLYVGKPTDNCGPCFQLERLVNDKLQETIRACIMLNDYLYTYFFYRTWYGCHRFRYSWTRVIFHCMRQWCTHWFLDQADT